MAARIESFRDLEAWQAAMMLTLDCYRLTWSFPPDERFGLTAQVRKSVVSIPSNVAEGHNRRSRLAYRNHVGIALGSQGRHEQTLATDQDNGILFADESGEPARNRERLLPLATRINERFGTAAYRPVGYPFHAVSALTG